MVSRDHISIRRGGLAAIAGVVVLTALAVTNSLLTGAAAQQPATPAAPGQSMASRKPDSTVGLRGHGFVRDEGGTFTTIDAPRAGLFTVAFGIDESGKTVGGYVDERGRLHGFLKDGEAFTVIDVPGAAATFAARSNAQGQIVGAYSEEPNTPALELSHGFLLDHGTFTQIDVPGTVRTQPYGINNRGQTVGSYTTDGARSHSFLLSNSVFTEITAPGAFQSTGAGYDIDDQGRIVGTYL